MTTILPQASYVNEPFLSEIEKETGLRKIELSEEYPDDKTHQQSQDIVLLILDTASHHSSLMTDPAHLFSHMHKDRSIFSSKSLIHSPPRS